MQYISIQNMQYAIYNILYNCILYQLAYSRYNMDSSRVNSVSLSCLYFNGELWTG